MKCPTPMCDNVRPPGARRRYCERCRQRMNYWGPGNKRAREVQDAIALRTRSLHQLQHIENRRDDIDGLRRRAKRATK